MDLCLFGDLSILKHNPADLVAHGGAIQSSRRLFRRELGGLEAHPALVIARAIPAEDVE